MDETEKTVQQRLLKEYWPQNKYAVTNCYLFEWESDFVMITTAGYIYEFEIKLSAQDYKKDFEKQDRHTALQLGIIRRPYRDWHWTERPVATRPNYFSYCCLPGVTDQVPDYAGLYVLNNYHGFTTVVKPPRLHNVKATTEQRQKILESAFYRFNYNFMKGVK